MRDVLTALCIVAFMFTYMGVPLFMIVKGWPVRAGLGMVLIACTPLIWWHVIQGLDVAIGEGILIMLLFPLPLFLIAVGLVLALVRLIRRIGTRT